MSHPEAAGPDADSLRSQENKSQEGQSKATALRGYLRQPGCRLPGDIRRHPYVPMIFGRPVRVTDGVFQIRAIGARVTVLVEDDEALLVDAGLRGSRSAITGGFKALGLSLDRLARGRGHPCTPGPFRRP